MKRRRKNRRMRAGLRTTEALMQSLVTKYRIAPDVREDTLLQAWERLVGTRVAARARPASLRNGTLTVIVKSTAWMQELSFMKDDLLEKLSAFSGDGIHVASIRLVLAGTREAHRAIPSQGVVRSRPKPRPRTYTPATGRDLDRIFSETQDVEDDELRELIYRTRAKHNR